MAAAQETCSSEMLGSQGADFLRRGCILEHQIFRFAKAFTLCGRRGTWRHRPSLCVAGQALGWLWWRAWVPLSPDRRGRLCGRRGTWRHPVSCGVAGVALGDIDLHFVWQARHLVASTFTLCGRRGTWRHRPSLCVSGQALMALGWLWVARLGPVVAVVAAAVCVAGVALGDI